MATKKSSTRKTATKKVATKKAATKKAATKKAPAKKAASKKKAPSKRTLIEPHPGDKRYVRRDAEGQFKKEVNVGRSLAADRRSTAKKTVPPGQGDRGDTKRSKKK